MRARVRAAPWEKAQCGIEYSLWLARLAGMAALIVFFPPQSEARAVRERIRFRTRGQLGCRIIVTNVQTLTKPWETVQTYRRAAAKTSSANSPARKACPKPSKARDGQDGSGLGTAHAFVYIDYNVDMSQVVSLRLPDRQAARLKRVARVAGRKLGETARILLDEALRQIEFAHIEFRDSAAGRQAYIKGRRTPVWMVMMIAERYNNDAVKTAGHFEWPVEWVHAAFHYARAFPDEIDPLIEDHRSITFEELQKRLPSLARFIVGGASRDQRTR